jgi:hypothetical protein
VSAIDLCEWCGALRLPRKTRCAKCGADHGSKSLLYTRDGVHHWVAIECTFHCGSCGFTVPLNQLDTDGTVKCARCGVEQPFEVRQWVDALWSAHAVGELFGDAGKGIDDAISLLGTERVSLAFGPTAPNGFTLTASPGHPLCEVCHSLVQVKSSDDGHIAITCGCGASSRYSIPEAARKMTKRALDAVIADEHRIDHAPVKVEETPTAIDVRCPNCQAALPASDESKFVECKYCKVVSRIPDLHWFRFSGKEPKPEVMWLRFNGRSKMHERFDKDRERVAREKAQKEERAQKHAQRENERHERERAMAQERRQQEQDQARARRENQEREQARQDDRSSLGIKIGIALILLGVVAFLAYSASR